MLERPLGRLERLIYRLLGPTARTEQDWKAYAKSTLIFSVVFWVLLYVILRTQGIHPFNPQGFNSARTTSRSTRRRRSSRTRTGSTTAARRRCRTSRRWPAWPSRTSSRPPSAWPSLVALIRGFACARGQGARQLLRRPHPHAALRAGAARRRRALVLVSQGVLQIAQRLRHLHGARRLDQTLALGPGGLAGSRSSSSAPTAAASSTSTRRCRSRTRRGSRTSSRRSSSC